MFAVPFNVSTLPLMAGMTALDAVLTIYTSLQHRSAHCDLRIDGLLVTVNCRFIGLFEKQVHMYLLLAKFGDQLPQVHHALHSSDVRDHCGVELYLEGL